MEIIYSPFKCTNTPIRCGGIFKVASFSRVSSEKYHENLFARRMGDNLSNIENRASERGYATYSESITS